MVSEEDLLRAIQRLSLGNKTPSPGGILGNVVVAIDAPVLEGMLYGMPEGETLSHDMEEDEAPSQEGGADRRAIRRPILPPGRRGQASGKGYRGQTEFPLEKR